MNSVEILTSFVREANSDSSKESVWEDAQLLDAEFSASEKSFLKQRILGAFQNIAQKRSTVAKRWFDAMGFDRNTLEMYSR